MYFISLLLLLCFAYIKSAGKSIKTSKDYHIKIITLYSFTFLAHIHPLILDYHRLEYLE